MACLSCFVLMIILGSSSAAGSQDCPVNWPYCNNICSIIPAPAYVTDTQGFHLYKKNTCLMPIYKKLQNNSIVHSFVDNESQCSRTIWCVSNSSNSTLRWHLPTSNSSSETIKLCLCTYINGGANNVHLQGCYSNKEGVHQCIQSNDNSNVSSTLQFTHSIYNLNINEICSTQISVTQTSCTTTSTVIMEKNCSTVSSSLILKESSTSSSMSSPDFLSCTSTLSSSYTLLSLLASSTSSTLVASSPVQSSTVSPIQSTVPHYTGIGLLVATNLLTIIALISSCVYIFCQRKKSKFIVTENEQTALQNTAPQTEATSHNTETNPNSNNNTNITYATNIYSSVEDEVDHYPQHHRPPARAASQYEVPLDLLQQAQVPLPPPPPLYATLDDQHDLTLPNPGYITNVVKEEGGERGEGGRREVLDYSYATVNKFLKKPTEDTEYNKLQHD